MFVCRAEGPVWNWLRSSQGLDTSSIQWLCAKSAFGTGLPASVRLDWSSHWLRLFLRFAHQFLHRHTFSKVLYIFVFRLLLLFLFFDYCLSVDLLIDFFTARWIVDSEGREHWRLVEDLYTIRQMYMFRCPENGFTLLPLFWLDIVGIIPWQYVDCLHASFQVLKNLRVFRLVEF